MRGRKPTPVEQRRLEGRDVSKRPLPAPLLVAGRPDGELDEPPDFLPDEAQQFWRSTVARLVEVGMLDLVDAAALQMLAVTYARWREAGRRLDRDGLVQYGKVGTLIAHPAVRIERDAHLLYIRTAEQFGLTPVARTRLGLAELHRRSLHAEMERTLGESDVLGSVAEDEHDDVGLPA